MSDLSMANQAMEGMKMTEVHVGQMDRLFSPKDHGSKTTVEGIAMFNGSPGRFQIVFEGGIPLQVDGTRIEQKP